MVFCTSDSNGTLVSLNQNGLKRSSSLDLLRASSTTQSYEFIPTDLLLPEDDEFLMQYDNDDDDNDNESFYSCSGHETCDEAATAAAATTQQLPKPCNNTRDRIYLPASNDLNIDECLKCLPSVIESCDNLLSQEPRHFDEQRTTSCSRTRLLYVGQQEAAYAVPSQCDVLLSDKATTCHILAMRSVPSFKAAAAAAVQPLISLTHIDGTHYETCIRAMVQKHLHHHRSHFCDQMDDSSCRDDNEGKNNNENDSFDDDEELVQLDLHIMGGFNDRDGTSRKISDWLFRLLANIATEEKHRMVATLATCAISSLNDNGQDAPIGRGLGINTSTGEVFLASCDASVAGPDSILRSLRLWNHHSGQPPRLEVIHCEKANMIKVSPFYFMPFPELNHLLQLPDDELLQCTSTSPDCEDEDFCPRLREALVFLRNVRCESVFGRHVNRTRYFQRIGFSNTWKSLFG